jgi:hypothetical protein
LITDHYAKYGILFDVNIVDVSKPPQQKREFCRATAPLRQTEITFVTLRDVNPIQQNTIRPSVRLAKLSSHYKQLLCQLSFHKLPFDPVRAFILERQVAVFGIAFYSTHTL